MLSCMRNCWRVFWIVEGGERGVELMRYSVVVEFGNFWWVV